MQVLLFMTLNWIRLTGEWGGEHIGSCVRVLNEVGEAGGREILIHYSFLYF